MQIIQPIKTALFSVLAQEMPHMLQDERSLKSLQVSSLEQQRTLLGNLLILADTEWSEHVLSAIDVVYNEEHCPHNVSSYKDLDVATSIHKTNLYVFKGDITTLQVDAIVNAANAQGRGCFQPDHRCIDNVIHRAAGPRLCMECRNLMTGRTLDAGSLPIVTGGYHLPAKYVVHVTGPQIARDRRQEAAVVKSSHRELLKQTYWNILDTAVLHNLQSIAIPCISTGLFGFPADQAATIAVRTVCEWLHQYRGPDHELQHIIFDVFSDCDEVLYHNSLDEVIPASNTLSPRNLGLQLAKHYISNAEAVLIVAGAGMSVKPGEMVYTNATDFARHYPYVPKWGYSTAYETMGLQGDPHVPDTAKWGFQAKHMDNMRWEFVPSEGYNQLLSMVKDKPYFVLTSNVDGCFERSGFDTDMIYTPQGEWTYLQCMRPCREDAVFEARPYLDKIVPAISADGVIPHHLVPKCPHCGGKAFGNVRGGSWFLHSKYEEQNAALQRWMQDLVDSKKAVAVIEIGAGFNTPMVTRFPAESFVRALGDRGSLIRINPSDPEVPVDLRAVSIKEGWQVLKDIANARVIGSELESSKIDLMQLQSEQRVVLSPQETSRYAKHFGHFNWSHFLSQLARD
jgi:O-acetyl-ADP-ribose deacetylase (regulator of RNase III)/NAD-dependent SIR2 family protein deacetylase